MWLAPAQLAVMMLILLVVAGLVLSLGTGGNLPRLESRASQARWVFTPSPGPLSGDISLREFPRRWKIVLGWSVLGIVMAVMVLFASIASRPQRCFQVLIGACFTVALWGLASHTATMEITANDRGIRMISSLGWRDVPWELVRGIEDKEILNTYYNGNMRMWEMPWPGSTTRLITLAGERGFPLMTITPEVEPKAALRRLLDLCERRTGTRMERRKINLNF
jgi:hypothetical protein